jgi:hypothetical protein
MASRSLTCRDTDDTDTPMRAAAPAKAARLDDARERGDGLKAIHGTLLHISQ